MIGHRPPSIVVEGIAGWLHLGSERIALPATPMTIGGFG
jgi:hypothetical protein